MRWDRRNDEDISEEVAGWMTRADFGRSFLFFFAVRRYHANIANLHIFE